MLRRPSVEKVGGTSMAATKALLDNVLIAGREGDDLYDRMFVVSAYSGMTDLLLEHKKSGQAGVWRRFNDADPAWRDALDGLREAMRQRNAQVLTGADQLEADRFVDRRLAALEGALGDLDRLRLLGCFDTKDQLLAAREMLAGLGEAQSAHNTVLLLRSRGINARLVDLTAWDSVNPPPMDERLKSALAQLDLGKELPIVTGYVACEGGMFRQFGRGYTEMTFSRLAVLADAREAIIHKEFHLSSADPRIVGVERARKIGRTSFEVADQLANIGMEAIHPGAGRGLRKAGIALYVRNTFDRNDEGTLICPQQAAPAPRVEIVSGVRELQALEFFDQDMVGERGYDASILQTLARQEAWIVSKSSNANTITHYLAADAQTVARVVDDLRAQHPTARIQAQAIAMVAVMGRNLPDTSLVSRAVDALRRSHVKIAAMQHQIRNVDLQIFIARDDFDAAVRALHAAFIEDELDSRRAA